jgi:hypothetical protein
MHSRMTLTLKVGILAVVWHMASLLWKFVQIISKSLEKNGLPSQDHVKPWSLSMALTVEIRVRLLCTTHHYCQHLCQIISKSSDRWKCYGPDTTNTLEQRCWPFITIYDLDLEGRFLSVEHDTSSSLCEHLCYVFQTHWWMRKLCTGNKIKVITDYVNLWHTTVA